MNLMRACTPIPRDELLDGRYAWVHVGKGSTVQSNNYYYYYYYY